ncbi:amino acid permease [Bacillus sp. DJP31]|uniref:amino acid permease n=1 Tax=Bacillus sp. DJP31 TaxID=3409789 RepID=UPI003BB65D3C
MSKKSKSKKGNLKWWQLSLLGVASIIGTGFFLGSSLAIKTSGPSILIAFLIAALGTYIVFNALARMTADHPEKGSFRSYAKKAFGRWAGFSNGWVYWSSEVLIMGSQLTALGLFTRFWFEKLPLWMLTSVYAALGILVLLLGVSSFQKIENILAVLKVAAILMFIIIACAALFGFIDGKKEVSLTKAYGSIFPNGVKGLWTALIYAFYAFGGIEVMGIMAMDLKNPKDAPKSGKIMLLILATIYVLSLGLAITLLNWDKFSTKQSPFIAALEGYNLPFIPHIFNAVLIIGGFSTMVAALYAVTNMIVTLSEEGDAPAVFQKKKGKRELPIPALCLSTGALIFSIVVSLLLPDKLYEYITTAAGLMLLYTWMFILLSFRKLMKLTTSEKVLGFVGILLILLAVSGTIFEKTSRIGFFVSLLFLVVIGFVTLLMKKKWKQETAT